MMTYPYHPNTTKDTLKYKRKALKLRVKAYITTMLFKSVSNLPVKVMKYILSTELLSVVCPKKRASTRAR